MGHFAIDAEAHCFTAGQQAAAFRRLPSFASRRCRAGWSESGIVPGRSSLAPANKTGRFVANYFRAFVEDGKQLMAMGRSVPWTSFKQFVSAISASADWKAERT